MDREKKHGLRRNWTAALLVAGVMTVGAAGCGPQQQPAGEGETDPAGGYAPAVTNPAEGPSVGATDPNTPVSSDASPAEPATPEIAALDAKLAQNPEDSAVKEELAEALYQVGFKTMMDDDLAPREKYPEALRIYRRVLELNPDHLLATRDKSTIENIYTSMGRPIPQ
jgi:tetratricopeptide (TPR) repeat protein